MRKLRIICVLVLVLLALVAILQNTRPMPIRFLFFSMTLSSAALIGIVFLVGFAVGLLVALSLWRKSR